MMEHGETLLCVILWAKGYPHSWVSLEEISIWFSRRRGFPLTNVGSIIQFNPWPEDRKAGGEVNEFPPALGHQSSWFSGLQSPTELHHWLS